MRTQPWIRRVTRGALIAALYTALCMVLAPISFGEVQFRVSEMLTILPLLLPEAIPGLFIGCLIANLMGGAGIMDVVFGSLATLVAGGATWMLRKKFNLPPAICVLPVVIINALIVGWVLNVAYGVPLLLAMGSVGLGQAVVVYALGLPLYALLGRTDLRKILD